MRRRDFVASLGVAAAWPLAVRAQPAMPVVGFLRSTSLDDASALAAAFRRGLKEAGFTEGQNVQVDYRYADHHRERVAALAADLIRRPVAVIIGDSPSAMAAKAATTTVPIVFASGGDPVRNGLVASLNRPGGNVTGVAFLGGVLGSKRLELFRQLVPRSVTMALIVNPGMPTTETERSEVQAAARAIGQELVVLDATSDRDLETAFTTIAERGAGALLIGAGAFMNSHRERLVALAARHALPAIYHQREAVAAGGLMSYGTSITDAYRQAGNYVGRILKGEKPADLPVVQATKFELVLNLKTAKALGLEVSPALLALADEVID